MDPTKIYKIESHLIITREELHIEYDLCGVFFFLVWSFPCSKWFFFPFPMQIIEVGILLIWPSPVRKFWILDTPKETGSIGSTQRRVETLWRSIVTCQDLVVREWIVFLRHEDFNRSIFDLVELLLERSDLGYSCFLNKDPSYVLNQKYSRILESDWLSSAGRFEH